MIRGAGVYAVKTLPFSQRLLSIDMKIKVV